MNDTTTSLRSLLGADGELRLTLDDVPIGTPGPDEVVVRVEATPINPSDLGELLGPVDLSTLSADASPGSRLTTGNVPPGLMRFAAARAGRPLSPGLEGAGTVVCAGENAQHLIGKVVGAWAGRMYTRYRRLPASEVIPFSDGVAPKHAAAAFVNPLTALGMVSTMRLEGHTALVHTAAASNLGQMLNKLCLADDVELVNIVRSEEQQVFLRSIGAKHVVNSTAPDFREHLRDAVSQTGATLGFDAVGGGPLASEILGAMEAVLAEKFPPTNQYGSTTHKQVYIYGRLDLSPTSISPGVGMAWGIGGWLVFHHLKRIGAEAAQELVARVASEITTTFASSYTREISLEEALDPDVIRSYQRKATGEKYLIVPSKN
jgi:NADPH:quinone reductase